MKAAIYFSLTFLLLVQFFCRKSYSLSIKRKPLAHSIINRVFFQQIQVLSHFPQTELKASLLNTDDRSEKKMIEIPVLDLSNSYDVHMKGRPVPIGSTPQFSIEGDSTEETPSQRLVVFMHFLLVGWNVLGSFTSLQLLNPLTWLNIAAVASLSVILGDIGTGIFHWSVDNYGGIKTPVFGTVCAAFQGHHNTPWTITFRPFANNVYKIAYATVPFLGLLGISQFFGFTGPLTRIFFALFINWWLLSQELHKYSHMKNLPPLVKRLQNAGIILSRKEHGQHHLSPYEGHYCILTGACNPFLDKIKFFRHLEYIVYKLTGNRPNTWKEDVNVEREAFSLYRQ